MSETNYTMKPIGNVKCSRTKPEDDSWDSETSTIELDPTQFTAAALDGLSSFSHIEVIFYMHQVIPEKLERGSRHPRGNQAWPKVGIFAQRAKDRPNPIGTTICQIERVDGLTIQVRGLDAIDGSPVLDIKPWVQEFGPRGTVKQPTWISELMRCYWAPSSRSAPESNRVHLELCPASVEYAEATMDWRVQESTKKYNPIKTLTFEELKEALRTCQHNLDDLRENVPYGWFLKLNDQLVSKANLSSVNLMMGTAEIGYTVAEKHHGKGIGTETVRIIVNHVFEKTKLRRLVAFVHEDNKASCRVLEKLGFSREGLLREHYIVNGIAVNEVAFGLLRSDWNSK